METTMRLIYARVLISGALLAAMLLGASVSHAAGDVAMHATFVAAGR